MRGGGVNWGRLEIAHAGQFGSVCGSRIGVDFDDKAASVACQSMGFQESIL